MRDRPIDVLRFLGIALIVLAHLDTPRWVFQLRNFDVPLIMMASGMALRQAGFKGSYSGYLWKRIKRLLFPVWLFLTGYFSFLGLTGIPLERLTFDHILESYLLLNGGDFVWIIRVFLLVTLTGPFILATSQRVKSNTKYLWSLVLIYLAYEGFLYLTDSYLTGNTEELVSAFFCYAIAFSVIFALGVRLNELSFNETSVIAGLSFFSLFVLGWIHYSAEGHIVSTQTCKNPPSAYYLSYATAMSVLVWEVVKRIDRYWSRLSKVEEVVMFVARNSLWVYLWHIPLVRIAQRVDAGSFVVEYLLVFAGAVFMTFVQVMTVEKYILPIIQNENTKKNIRIILTG